MKFSITNAASSVHTGYGYVTSKIMRNILDTGHKLLVERNADVEFCFNLPKFFKFSDNPNSRKVGYMAWESTNLQDGWQGIINEKCDEIWVPSNFVKDVVEQYTDKEVYVFKHGVDSTFPAKRKERTDKVKFLSMGYPALRKDIPHVIDSFLELYAGSKDHELTIKIYEKYNNLEINEPNIKIIDKTVSYPEVASLMHDHDVLLYPSWGEGFGLIPLQAMATGTPSIITNGWADYTKYSQGLTIMSTLEDSPWQHYHPGKQFKPDHEDFIRLIQHTVSNLDIIQENQFHLAEGLHLEYEWKRVIKEHFDSVEARLMV
jgi:glycosyltransferase involved in cell wall biosynthesis